MRASPEPAEGEPEPALADPPALSPEAQQKLVSSEALRELTKGLDVELALELDGVLERTIATFEKQNVELIRKACGVPEAHADIRDVVLCTFLGHVLNRLEAKKGRPQTAELTTVLLAQFERARQHVGVLTGPPAMGQAS